VADALLARFRHQARLRMTRQEVIEEHRQTEGDPRSKARRKALHRSLLLAGRARGVRSADVLVVNPTHLAVALRYAPLETEAPYLVAKGRGAQAQALRRESERCGIPVVRDVPLARSLILYDVGEEIPEELYQAAAAVLEVVARTGGEPGAGGPG
jgi:type III secretion protein U